MKIKICGLTREQDVDYVNEAMPDYAGFILCFPKSHRNLTTEKAKLLRSLLRPEILPVCVFVDQPVKTVIRTARIVRPAVLQLHGHENDSYIAELKEQTGLEIWKAFQVRDEVDLEAAARCRADRVLLDNGYGTGEVFDWSRAVSFSRPFILAGGLTPENIPDAAAALHPVAVDLSSGTETKRHKDRDKILSAVAAAHTAVLPAETMTGTRKG